MYIALKPCTISCKKYFINDEVDTTNLSDSELKRLAKMKLIVEAGTADVAVPAHTVITLPIINNDGVSEISLTAEGIYNAIKAIQSKADEAVEIAKNATTEAELILIHKLDTRTSVQKAAVARVNEITNESDA